MRHLMAVAALVLLAACGDGGTEPVDPRVAAAGVYTLTAVNDGPLPGLYYEDEVLRADFTSGTFTVRADGSYTESITVRVTYKNGDPTETIPFVENGTYTLVGTGATFSVPPSGGQPGYSYTGTIGDGTVSYEFDGLAMRYQK